MDVRTPLQIVLGTLLACIALATLGLVADNAAYVHKHQNPSPMDIHYIRWNATAQTQYSYWVTIDYLPSSFDMGRTYATLVASLFCCITGAGVAIATWMMRSTKTTEKTGVASGGNRSSALLYSLVAIPAITFCVGFAMAIYAWQPVMRWPISFLKSLPVSPSVSGANPDALVVYESPFELTPDTWNCWIAPYVVQPAQQQKIHSLCREAVVAKDLMVPMVLLSAALLCSVLWMWRQVRLNAASAPADLSTKDVEEVSIESKE